MRQLLILGFHCEVYRREPRCRVYVNDVLLDEFNLPHTVKKKLFNTNNNLILDPKEKPEDFNLLFYKLMEFDNKDTKEIEIKIEVQNNDNNYTNGFMTKSTLIKMPYVYLLSKKLLSKINDLKNNWKFNKQNYYVNNVKDIFRYYSGSRNHVYENFSINLQLNFPDIIQQQRKVEEFKTYCNNRQNLFTVFDDHPGQYWIGSTGYFYLKLKKKLGLWSEQSDCRKGYRILGNSEFIKYVYDKYKQHEDQRSSNT